MPSRGPYHKEALEVSGPSPLRGLIDAMTARTKKRLYTQIETDAYTEMAYPTMAAFLDGIAAICKKFPEMLGRKTGRTKTIVLGSLMHATSPSQLPYLQNYAKFIAAHPDIEVMYGTTQNEAFHQKLKGFFRNVMIQTRRNAKAICQVTTLAKLIGGSLAKSEMITSREEHELLRTASSFLWESPLRFRPFLDLKTEINEHLENHETQRPADNEANSY